MNHIKISIIFFSIFLISSPLYAMGNSGGKGNSGNAGNSNNGNNRNKGKNGNQRNKNKIKTITINSDQSKYKARKYKEMNDKREYRIRNTHNKYKINTKIKTDEELRLIAFELIEAINEHRKGE